MITHNEDLMYSANKQFDVAKTFQGGEGSEEEEEDGSTKCVTLIHFVCEGAVSIHFPPSQHCFLLIMTTIVP